METPQPAGDGSELDRAVEEVVSETHVRVESLRPERSLNHLAFTRIMFALQTRAPGHGTLTLPGLKAERLEVDTATAKFDLTITFHPTSHPDGTPAGINGTITYATDILNPQTITTLTNHLTTLLTNATNNPDTPVDNLEGGGS